MSVFFYPAWIIGNNFASKNYEGIKPQRLHPCIRIWDVDESAHADGDFFQDSKRVSTHKYQQEEGTEIQYADVLVHRKGVNAGQGVLYAPGRRQTY